MKSAKQQECIEIRELLFLLGFSTSQGILRGYSTASFVVLTKQSNSYSFSHLLTEGWSLH